jgi:transcriptional regulator with XRE-family HTH domain
MTQPATPASPTVHPLDQLAAQITACGLESHGRWANGEPGQIAVCHPGDPDLGWVVIDHEGHLAWQRHCRLATTADIHAVTRVITVLLDLTTPPTAPESAARTPNLVLRTWREEHGFSRARMAEALNDTPTAQHHCTLRCDPALISQWESGRIRWPSPKYQRALHDLTGQHPTNLGFTAPTPRPRRQIPITTTIQADESTGPSTDTSEFDGYLTEALRNPAFRSAYQDAQTRSLLLDHLIRLRISQGISQTEIATRMQTNQPVVCELENGGTDPQLSTLQRYARALDTRLTITLARFPIPPPPSPGTTSDTT